MVALGGLVRQSWRAVLEVQIRRAGTLTSSATTQAQIQGTELAHPKIILSSNGWDL